MKKVNPMIVNTPDLWMGLGLFARECLAGNDTKENLACPHLRIFELVFDTQYSLTTPKGQKAFEELLRPLLTATGQEKENLIALFPLYASITPEPVRSICIALLHPDCPADLISLAARHDWNMMRRYAVANPNCSDEDRVYSALLSDIEVVRR